MTGGTFGGPRLDGTSPAPRNRRGANCALGVTIRIADCEKRAPGVTPWQCAIMRRPAGGLTLHTAVSFRPLIRPMPSVVRT